MSAKKIKKILFDKFSDNSLKSAVYKAPGRVNIIGEHMDYNDGFVLPIAINKKIMMAAQLREDKKVNIYSIDFDQKVSFDINNFKKLRDKTWANYIMGVFDQFIKRGNDLSGANIVFTGDIPLGAGLSSSAALEVVTAVMISNLNNLDISGVETALLCQKAENDYVGVNSGLMDQYISRLGQKDKALLIDCRSNEYKEVLFADDAYQLVIADTKVSRELVDSEYNKRRQECNKAVDFFDNNLNRKIESLRDISYEDYKKHENKLQEFSNNAAKRAKHVIKENKRVLDAVKAIENGDFSKLGRLMNESHQSLRDDYEVSCKELDLMVEIARKEGSLGSRMTGAGFGGCTVSLVKKESTSVFKENLKKIYKKETGIEADIYISSPENGAGQVELK